jgi:hypothetical protein
MELDALGDTDSAPGGGEIIVVCGDDISPRCQSWFKSARHAPLESVAGDALHFGSDGVERLSFALADFDREELEQMTIVIRRGRSRSFGAVDESCGDVEADRARAWRGAGARVSRA